MSQTPAHSNGKAHSPHRVGALHRQGDRWRLLILEGRGEGAVLEARTLAADPWGAVADATERHRLERVVVVAPGRATVARCAGVPTGTPEEMGAAASLMAEVQLPESLPAHRRSAAVIPDEERPGLRTALLTGWAPDGRGPSDAAPEGTDVSYTTPIAALAALRGGTGAALYADPHEGAVSMIAGGAERTLVRVLVEESAGGGFWRAVSLISAETAAAAGVPAPAVSPGSVGPALRLDPRSLARLRSAVRDVPDRAEWLNDYGVALGAALLATSPDLLLRPLASLRESAPVIREPVLSRAVGWLAIPRNAWVVVAASLALLLLGPLALGAARLAIVEAKARGLPDGKERGESARRQAMVAQLERSRWPMTKLLADVSAAAPVGVVADTVRISTDQGVTITGTAESPEQVNVLQSNLNDTRLFSDVRVNRVESTPAGVDFDITASVSSPYANVTVKPETDFAARPLAVRLYGDEKATNTATPVPRRRSGESTTSAAAPREGRRGRDRGGDGEGAPAPRITGDRAERPREGVSTRAAPPNPGDAPKPLTDEQIAAMDQPTATREMVQRRVFSQKAGLEAGTKQRLEDEVNRLKARLDQLRAAGGGSQA
ncbi:MAG: PilN domain-containing protein [Phycisphaerales bacterium]